MATSLEGKLLGERRDNYASSSDEDEAPAPVSPPNLDGLPQTGPKGVLTDYYRSQKEEEQKRIIEEKVRKELIKKHTATVASDNTELKSEDAISIARALEEGALNRDPFVQEYRAKRLEEMKQQAKMGSQRVIFGNLVEIRGDKYSATIDSAPPQTFLILHIYEEMLPACRLLNKCLSKLAKSYTSVKFCRVQQHQVGVSQDFAENALPALLVYRGGVLLGNLLRVTDSLGEEFTEEDVEAFLKGKNCLPSRPEKTALSSDESNSD